MNRRIIYFVFLYAAVAVTPSLAQEDTDPFEEEFGDEFLDEEGFLEEEDFPLEGEEFGDEEFLDDEGFDEEGFDDEGLAGFDDMDAAPLEDDFEGDTRLGYTFTVSGGMPTFRNSTLLPWLGTPNGRVGVDLPFYLSMGPIGFRVGAEVGTYDFNYDETGLVVDDKAVLPLEGKLGGIGFFGVITIPSGPANLRVGVGMVGTSPAYMAVQSIGMALGDLLDLRLGVRATAAYNVPDGLTTTGTHMSWVDAFMALGMTF
ncbi:MAG: hypothetical protein VX822_02780 [Candidatus Neomarinimicrobiota bacterium]|nr:hypothetical protein [Candidatus Neomarinimicrobiota bacterium]